VIEGDTQAFDTKILQALRDPHDPSKLIGPPWLEGSLLDLTALGGPTVLTLVVLAVIGFLLLQTRYRTALFVVATWLSGELVNSALKHAFNRPRPTIVPHLREVFSTSFPSGHAMESAIVYLTLGAILMRVAEDRLTKVYCLGIAVLLTVVVGAEPGLPGRPLPDGRHRRLDHRLRVGVNLLAGGRAIRRQPPASRKRKPKTA
jgi:undecaprenyl-diphosphatase